MSIELSTGKLCSRCGCQSLEIYYPLKRFMNYYFDTFYHCVAECGMDFGLSRVGHKIKMGYNFENALYLMKRFKFTEDENDPRKIRKTPKPFTKLLKTLL